MYVRHKFIKGHKYFYLVYGERQNGKVKQRHVRYLGKTPWGYVAPTRFSRVVDKALTKVEQLPFYRRHAKKAARAAGITDAPAKVQDRVHALGHVIDQTLAPQGRRTAHLGSRSKAFTAFRDELDQVANVMGNGKRQTRADRFADLVTLCLTQPRKAEKLAPQATAWLRDTLYDRPAIREGLTRAGLWELEGRRTSAQNSNGRSKKRPKRPKPPPVFTGLPDITTSVLDQLSGRRTVSKQFIDDLTRSPGMQRAERVIIKGTLSEMGDEIEVQEFAHRVRANLLSLEAAPTPTEQIDPGDVGAVYANIVLPAAKRGEVDKYFERIYESPIKTSAGDIHFGGSRFNDPIEIENYFAHTRIEDMGKGSVRRVIEVQSDLFQKGSMEREDPLSPVTVYHTAKRLVTPEEWENINSLEQAEAIVREKGGNFITNRQQELAQLKPYRNRWWRRIIHEEIKRAAKDGKTKVQFPSGETAMRIEGLGEPTRFRIERTELQGGGILRDYAELTQANMRAGQQIFDNGRNEWIITDVLGDGKFKAAQKQFADKYNKNTYELFRDETSNGTPIWSFRQNGHFFQATMEDFPENIRPDRSYGTFSSKKRAEAWLEKFTSERYKKNALGRLSETFDISGKVDTTNPIYKFYERLIQKYLRRIRPDMRRVTDRQGVEWFEIDLTPEDATRPVPAFGA